MKPIPSFTIDHEKMLRGIYVSRKDQLGSEVATTFDIRMKEPNREPVMDTDSIHTIEHLAATYLRNHPTWAEKLIYWGPMGCRTGNYMVMKGDLESTDIVEIMVETFRFMAEYQDAIPAEHPRECGNYLDHNLPMARWESKKFLEEVLLKIQSENLHYPE